MINISTGKGNASSTPHYTPAQRQLLTEAAAKRGFRAYNPLWFLYCQMGILVFRKDGHLRALRLCFRDYNLTFWFI